MTFRRSDGPADRAESERLLDGARAGRPPQPGDDPLTHLLAAAATPAGPGELPGEEQAVAAFRAARANPVPAPAPAPRRRRIRVGAAAWAAGLAATATAGVTFAAVSLDRPEQPAPPVPSTAGSGDTGSTARSQEGTPGAGTSGPAASPTPVPGGPGHPATMRQLTGLCRAYLAKPDPQRATALAEPAFADLVVAAGGADRVAAYCVQLVPDEDSKPSPGTGTTRSPGSGNAATPDRPRAEPGPLSRGRRTAATGFRTKIHRSGRADSVC